MTLCGCIIPYTVETFVVDKSGNYLKLKDDLFIHFSILAENEDEISVERKNYSKYSTLITIYHTGDIKDLIETHNLSIKNMTLFVGSNKKELPYNITHFMNFPIEIYEINKAFNTDKKITKLYTKSNYIYIPLDVDNIVLEFDLILDETSTHYKYTLHRYKYIDFWVLSN